MVNRASASFTLTAFNVHGPHEQEGARGSGKSRLLDELYGVAATAAAQQRGASVSIYLSGAESTMSSVAYHVWSAIILEMLDVTQPVLCVSACVCV